MNDVKIFFIGVVLIGIIVGCVIGHHNYKMRVINAKYNNIASIESSMFAVGPWKGQIFSGGKGVSFYTITLTNGEVHYARFGYAFNGPEFE
jgi:hypothetical protein